MSPFHASRPQWLLFVGALIILPPGCGGGGGGDSAPPPSGSSPPPEAPPPTPPPSQDNFNGRIYPLGTEIAAGGSELIVYTHAIDAGGNPILKDDFKPTKVVLRDSSGATIDLTNSVAIEPVTDGSFMSLSFVTDYSYSIPDASLQALPGIYASILNALPAGYAAQVLDFSETIRPRTTDAAGNPVFSPDPGALQNAVQYIPDPYKEQPDNAAAFRKSSALYNALGYTLYGPYGAGDGLKDGLLEQCAPVHLLILYSDGENNVTPNYDKNTLLADIDTSNTIPIVLAIESTDPAVTNIDALKELARPIDGNPDTTRGAFVYGHNTDEIASTINRYAASLSNTVRLRIGGYTFTNGDVLELTVGDSTVPINLKDADILSSCP